MTKKLHISIATHSIEQSIQDYNKRLGCEPCSWVANEYALWRLPGINFSIRQDENCPVGALRHLGVEDPTAEGFSSSTDVNGVLWEHFAAIHQEQEIKDIWPDAICNMEDI
jgi:hypothetical protein